MSGLRSLIANLVVLGWMLFDNRCCAQTQFTSCFNRSFLGCAGTKCKARSTLSATLSRCTAAVGEAKVRACTSGALARCAAQPGAKSLFMCGRAASNYAKNPTVARERRACLAMKGPCQELMACAACGRNDCGVPLGPLAPKPPTSPPVRPPTSPPVRRPTSPPVRPPTFSPLKVVGNPGTPTSDAACTTEDCRGRAACCASGGGTLVSAGCINCLPLVYGGFYQCGFCDRNALPENQESCDSFAAESEWLMCEWPSGNTCNVQFCSWSGLQDINNCATAC